MKDLKEKIKDIIEDTKAGYEHELDNLGAPMSLMEMAEAERFRGALHACSYLLSRLEGMGKKEKK